MEDVCYFLKYGKVLHGEWFINGQRVPLASGSHRQPLPPGLSERPAMEPDFPEMARMEVCPLPPALRALTPLCALTRCTLCAPRQARTDGCPNQFDYGTNYHQTAEWRSKTAQWVRQWHAL